MTVKKSKETEKMLPPATRKVAPDGGWAWMVCFGVSLVNFSTRSLEPSFGLLFKELLDDLDVHTTGAAVIASTYACVVNFSGFIVGPVIKTFSYRKVCFLGSVLCALGLLFTAPANSMTHILATYSILGGFGVGLASSSSFVSINHYFSKKRGQAVGLSMAGTGFGQMVMPQLVKILLIEYGSRWTVVILGGMAFNAVLGSCLLQPVKRHLIDEPVDCEMQLVKEIECIHESDKEADSKFEINPLVTHPKAMPKLTKQRSHGNMNHPSAAEDDAIQMKAPAEEKKTPGFLKKFISLMDLDLLKDWSFLNLLLGVSMFWSAELQFRMLMPFFIRNLGYNMDDTAFCLSITAISDISVRLVLPPIFDRTKLTKKMIFFVSSFFLAVMRSVLAEQTEWIPLLIWLAICGFFRGMCLSNLTLTISEYCPLEKLPAAFGLHMVSKGVLVMLSGPLIGYVRDYTGSFATCIHVQNAMIMSCVLVWGIEYVLTFTRRRKVVQI